MADDDIIIESPMQLCCLAVHVMHYMKWWCFSVHVMHYNEALGVYCRGTQWLYGNCCSAVTVELFHIREMILQQNLFSQNGLANVRRPVSLLSAWPTYVDHGHARLKKYFFPNWQSMDTLLARTFTGHANHYENNTYIINIKYKE